MRWGVSLIFYAVNGTREAAALPLSIPAAPRGNRCCALRSPPACLTAAGSTRHPVSVRLCPPSMASRPCHSRSGSPISAGIQPLAVSWASNEKMLLLKPRRPDKRLRAIRHCLSAPIAGWRLRLIRPTVTKPLEPRRPDKRLRAIRHYLCGTDCRMAASPYPAYEVRSTLSL